MMMSLIPPPFLTGTFNNIKWELYKNEKGIVNLVKFSGNGIMSKEIWYSNGSLAGANIEHIIVDEGITEINDACITPLLKTIKLPSTLRGSINFEDCQHLTELEIPDGVSKIASLSNCRSLEKIIIPDTVEIIGGKKEEGGFDISFKGCNKLKTIKLPNNNKFIAINESLFWGCTSLESIEIPDSVVRIEDFAFYQCSHLKKIILPKNLVKIGNAAFNKCVSLQELQLPSSLKYCGDAFKDCSSLAGLSFPSSCLTIPGEFDGCNSMEYINVESGNPNYYSVDGVLYQKNNELFGDYLVYYPSNNKNDSFVIPQNVKNIISFGANNYVKTVVYPKINNILAEIGNELEGCSNLEAIYIPSNYNSISLQVGYVPSLLYIYGESGSYAEKWAAENGLFFIEGYPLLNNASTSNVTTSLITTTTATTTTTTTTTTTATTTTTTTTAPTTTTVTTRYYTDENADGSLTITRYEGNLIDIIIPDSLFGRKITRIGDRSFDTSYAKYSAKSIIIPESVTYIGDYAFSSCIKLENVTIPDSVVHIGESAFSSCSSLNDISLPKYISEIKDGTFYGCSSLTAITIPENVTSIGDWAFNHCEMLSSVTIPKNVISIGEEAFFNCYSLSEIRILNPQCKISGITPFATIYGYKGSTAEEYARTNGNNFVSINSDITETTTTTMTTTTTTTTTATSMPTSTTVTTTLGLSIEETSITLQNGDQYTIKANQTGLTYSSNNKSVAVVSKEGVITAVGEGEATISVINDDSDVVQLTVVVEAISTTTILTTSTSTTTSTTSTTIESTITSTTETTTTPSTTEPLTTTTSIEKLV